MPARAGARTTERPLADSTLFDTLFGFSWM
jgi:hypothetical protein